MSKSYILNFNIIYFKIKLRLLSLKGKKDKLFCL